MLYHREPSQSLARLLVRHRHVRDDVRTRPVVAEISSRLRGHASERTSSRSPQSSSGQHHANAS